MLTQMSLKWFPNSALKIQWQIPVNKKTIFKYECNGKNEDQKLWLLLKNKMSEY